MADAFRQIAPDRLQIREGGGCLGLFGLPFFAAGLFICLSAVGVVPISNASEFPGRGAPFFLFGLPFLAVGTVLVFGRAWTTIDGTARLVTKEWGLIWPMYSRPSNLEGYTSVTIAFESGDSDSAAQFPIFLRASGTAGLKLCSYTQYAKARECAAAVAGLLQLDFEDASTDHAQRTSASQAGLSLQERSRAEWRQDDVLSAPALLRSTMTDDDGTTRIVMPTPPTPPLVLALQLLPTAIGLFLISPLGPFRQTRAPQPIEWVFLGLLILGFCVLPGASALNAWLRSRVGRTIVSISSDSVQIVERGVWGIRSRKDIAVSDILDVDYSTRESVIESARRATEQRVLDAGRPRAGSTDIGVRTERLIAFVSTFAKGRGITLKTRQGLTRFGEGLGDEEIQYIHGVVRRALVRT